MSAPARLREVFREKAFWGLLVVGVAFFWRPLFTSESFYYRDISYLNVVQQAFFADSVHGGQWPLWDPYHHGGTPFWANLNNTPLYPANLLALIFTPYRAVTLSIVLHILGAALAAYLLSRWLAFAPPAAFLAGVSFAYCGYTLAQANTPGRLASLAYLPLMVLFWHRFLEERRGRWFRLTAAVATLQVLAGAPPICVFSFLTLLAWGWWGVQSPWSWIRRGALLGALGITVFALAAVQLIPLFELTGLSSRGQGVPIEDFLGWSVHPLRLPELVLPGFLGHDTMSLDEYWGHHIVDSGAPYIKSLYFGSVLLGLALVGSLTRPYRRRTVLLLTLAALGILASMGRYLPGFEHLYEIPSLRIFRFPSKNMVLSVLPVALLAAEGATKLFAPEYDQQRWRSRLVQGALILFALGGLSLLLLTRSPVVAQRAEIFLFKQSGPLITQGLQAAMTHALGFLVLAIAVLAMGALGLRALRGDRGRWAIAAIVLMDLMFWGRQINPSAPAELFSSVPEVANLVAETLSDGRQTPGRFYRAGNPKGKLRTPPPTNEVVWRHLLYRDILRNYTGASLRLPVVFHTDYDSLAPSRVHDITFILSKLSWERRLPLLSAAAVSAIMTHDPLELPGLEYVTTSHNPSAISYNLYRNSRAPEKATVVHRWRVAASPEDAAGELLAPGFDPRYHAVIEEEAGVPPANCAPGKVEIDTNEPQHQIYRVTTDCAAILVLSEVFYPGWHVRVDSEESKLLRTNYAWSGVALQPGTHLVEFRFAPTSVRWGALLSLIAIFLMAFPVQLLPWPTKYIAS